MAHSPDDALYLCLDQGGHASRALVFDGRGVLHASCLRPVDIRYPQPDWAEQDPEELVASLQAAMAQATTALGAYAGRLHSAGIATQRSSIVCWDRRTGVALSPVVSWQDRRAHRWLASFADRADEIHRLSGLMLSAHYGASKLRWCLDHLPAVAAAQRAGNLVMGPLASFLLFRLLEEKPLVVDPANAARTMLWNIHTLDWEPSLLTLFGVPAEALPRCVPTRYDFGTLRAPQRRIPLVIATGDQSAALFAHGAPLPDTAYINMGTGAFIQRVFDSQPEVTGLLTGVVYHNAARLVYVLEGTVNGAGAALKWAEQEWRLENIEAQLSPWLARAGDVPLFLNGVSGLGAPFWMAEFTSRWIGEGEAWQRVVAVAESIVFLLQTNLELMQKISPHMTRILATGGLARYDGLCQRLADLSGLPVHRPTEHEASARGTAYLLAACPSHWPEPEPSAQFPPRANPTLSARYQRWRSAMCMAVGD